MDVGPCLGTDCLALIIGEDVESLPRGVALKREEVLDTVTGQAAI
jgi:hypothetical protein